MKIKFLSVITCLLTAAFLLPSCLDDDTIEVEYSSESSITGFSINDIETTHTKKEDNVETSYTTTVKGENYPFAIDQKRRLIFNVDSLPVGTDIRKVVVNMEFDGLGIMIVSQHTEKKDSVWEAGDSLNFTKPIHFKAIAQSGASGPVYKAQINVHQQVPDSLQWQHLSNTFDPTVQAQKAVTLGENIYVFAQQTNGLAVTTTSIYDGKNWTSLQSLTTIPHANLNSIMTWGNQIFVIAEEQLYSSADAINWKPVATETRFSQLIAQVHTSHNQKLYAINTNHQFMDSEDGMNWIVREEVPAHFPTQNLMHSVCPLNTNEQIDRVLVLGQNNLETDTTTCVWTQLTTEHTWGDYPTLENDTYHCPKLNHQAVIYYNNLLYTFGGPGATSGAKISAFERFYQSEDQGISWKAVDKKVFFPKEFKKLYQQAEGHYSYVVDKNHFLWIIWSQSGQVWKGRINKLGFAPRK